MSMKWPARLTYEELIEHGYVLISKDRAKHPRVSSWRNRCYGCNDWVKQTNLRLCNKCTRTLNAKNPRRPLQLPPDYPYKTR